MDGVSTPDPALQAAFLEELRRGCGAMPAHLSALRADGGARADAEALERILHAAKGSAGTVGRADLAGRAAALLAELEAAVERGFPIPADAVARLIEHARALIAEAGLPPLVLVDAPARRPFAEEARAACRSVAALLRRINDVTFERQTRVAAREEVGALLHGLKGAAVLEGEWKTAGLAGRAVISPDDIADDPMGIELRKAVAPLLAKFDVPFEEDAAAAPLGAGAPTEVASPAAAPRALEIPAPLKEALARQSVLFVDDSFPIRKIAEKFLSALGVGNFALAVDGLDALARLRGARFDVVFTDIEMPRMHGYELVHEMRAHDEWKMIPVVIVTARSAEKHRLSAQVAGATDYLVKPFTREHLLEKLKAHGGFHL